MISPFIVYLSHLPSFVSLFSGASLILLFKESRPCPTASNSPSYLSLCSAIWVMRLMKHEWRTLLVDIKGLFEEIERNLSSNTKPIQIWAIFFKFMHFMVFHGTSRFGGFDRWSYCCDLERLLWPCGVGWLGISQICTASWSFVAHHSYKSSCQSKKAMLPTLAS